jgi:hypothetical protein
MEQVSDLLKKHKKERKHHEKEILDLKTKIDIKTEE